MAKFASNNFLDGGLSYLKNTSVRVALVSSYVAGDSFATMAANKVAEATVTTTDFTLSTNGSGRRVTTTGAKTASATANTQQYDNGTATSGSTTTLANTGKAWTTNAYAGKAVAIISGTGAGQQSRITSNTATVLTVAAWAVAPDATSVYRIGDDLHWVFHDNSAEIIWATPETTKQAVTSGNTVNFPAVTYDATQPV